jgi:hypothetical protein
MRTVAIALLLAALFVPGLSRADAPASIPMQGYLTDSEGQPVSGNLPIRFRLYSAPQDGSVLHEETQTVSIDAGYFTVYLGDPPAALDLDVFRANQIIFVGLLVGDSADELSPRFQLATAPYAAFAQSCGDANTVGGMSVDQLATHADITWTSLGSTIPPDIADGDATLTNNQVISIVDDAGFVREADLQKPSFGTWTGTAVLSAIEDSNSRTAGHFLMSTTTFTPTRNGSCLVMASMTARADASDAGALVYGRTAIKAGGAAPQNDGNNAPTSIAVNPGGHVTGSTPVSTWTVSAGTAYHFGCSFTGSTTLANNDGYCTVSWFCM